MDISANVGNRNSDPIRVWDLVRASSTSFSHLKELALLGVPVDDDEVSFLLSNSPLLECLSISGSLRLENVSVVGPKRLKRLDLSNSDILESVEVVDVLDLVSVRCYKLGSSGFIIKLKLDNVPMLTELGISEAYRNPVLQTLSGISSCVLDRLRTFRLWTPPPSIWALAMPPYMTNVRHLEIVVGQLAGFVCAYPLFQLIEACDSLETLEIKLLGQPTGPCIEKFKERKLRCTPPHEHLSSNIKKLKVSGYVGCPVETELVLFVMKNVSSLEEFVVQPFDQTLRLRQRAERLARKYFRRTAPNYVHVTII